MCGENDPVKAGTIPCI